MGFISMMKPADYDDQNLSPSDKQVISIAMRYDTIREGEWWGLIEEQMRQMEVLPIDADANYLEDRRERLFEACRAIQFEQMEITVVRNEEKVAQANVFIDNLLMQKNQQIKSITHNTMSFNIISHHLKSYHIIYHIILYHKYDDCIMSHQVTSCSAAEHKSKIEVLTYRIHSLQLIYKLSDLHF